MVTATTETSTRKRFFRLLADSLDSSVINFNSVAIGMRVTPSLLSRYLREARRAGWVITKKTMGDGLQVTIIDRIALQNAGGISEVPSRG